MKILHVIGGLPIGGSQNLLVNHLVQMDQAYPGIDNRLLVLGRRSDASEDYIKRLPIAPQFMNFSGRYRDAIASTRCISGIRRAIRACSPDIVHSYLWLSDAFTAIALGGSRLHHVSHVLDRRGDRCAVKVSSRWRTRFTGWLLRRSGARFAAVSEACRCHAIHNYMISPEAILTVHNAINPALFPPPPEPIFSRTPVTFGMISRFAEEKGHEHLIQAFERLHNSRIKIAIGGAGPTLNRISSMITDRGLSDGVRLLGQVPSAAGFYHQIDALVVPSVKAEGLPTTILEAMATGLPVIATDVGGAKEAIQDGKNGIIVPPRSALALAEAIAFLVNSPEEARRMGHAARKRVAQSFTVEAMTRRIVEDVYAPAFANPPFLKQPT